jgi:hypothetical protein
LFRLLDRASHAASALAAHCEAVIIANLDRLRVAPVDGQRGILVDPGDVDWRGWLNGCLAAHSPRERVPHHSMLE